MHECTCNPGYMRPSEQLLGNGHELSAALQQIVISAHEITLGLMIPQKDSHCKKNPVKTCLNCRLFATQPPVDLEKFPI